MYEKNGNKAGGCIEKRIIIELENFDEQEYEKIEKVFAAMKISFILMEKKLSFGGLLINPLERTVIQSGKEVILTAKEFDILYLLASYPGIVFTHRQIYESVWEEDSYLDEGNVTAHIGRIRKKIETNAKKPQYIQTVRGVGYKFIK